MQRQVSTPLPLLLIGSYRAGQRRHLQTVDSYIAI
jgi:hypothetical protein